MSALSEVFAAVDHALPHDGDGDGVGSACRAPVRASGDTSPLDIPHPLLASARARPAHLALVDGERSVSFATLAARASAWAAQLGACGVQPGDVVALAGTLDLEWVTGLHAIGLAHAVVAPVDPGCPAAARAEVLRVHEARWCVNAGQLICIARDGDAALTPAELPLDVPAPAGLRPALWALGAARVSLLTSGTTGTPRRVVLTTAQLLFSAMGSAIRLGHHLDDRWLLCLPTHHIGGLSILFRTAWLGTTAVLNARFEPTTVAAQLDAGAVSVVSLVPAMLSRVLDARPEAQPFPRALRAILVGGDRAATALVTRARTIGAPLYLTWGMSETASQIATSLPDAGATHSPDDVGPPLAFASVSRDAASGALVVEGPIAPGGRLVTADHGVVRADGHIEVHGRRDLVFVSGGENVDPARVEAALRAHPDVADALVVPVADRELGVRTAALLVARAGATPPDTAALRAQLAPTLTRAERPSHVRWVPTLPVGASGKPSRERASALLLEDLS